MQDPSAPAGWPAVPEESSRTALSLPREHSENPGDRRLSLRAVAAWWRNVSGGAWRRTPAASTPRPLTFERLEPRILLSAYAGDDYYSTPAETTLHGGSIFENDSPAIIDYALISGPANGSLSFHGAYFDYTLPGRDPLRNNARLFRGR
jgi:hypothetical protein